MIAVFAANVIMTTQARMQLRMVWYFPFVMRLG